ncbi:hypothetical protein H6F67_03865 [Microcoleus sp. FACHB-1515]|uniref:WcbI family polysaccharide biosynthesis putative acetyltransferase n=1 Tax=Cyanophyceae TaxID=3028117 RepID=UPI001685D39F|nr:WcbI family polysaccharide biosynthesis putative acetyltransferase [Microcoleus sp. FACHB-1515]MBD2088989.1 hypothetical protein [Microcoleus sp. FACHB-1515]
MGNGKEPCIIYANCQESIIRQNLLRSEDFNSKFTICCKMPRNYEAIQQNLQLPEHLIQEAKLFVYQPLGKEYEKLSTNYLLNLLPSDCICISLPYIYFNGYWPQYIKSRPGFDIAYNDSNIAELLKSGKTKAEILKIISSSEVYDVQFLLKRVEDTLNELQRREVETDVKVSKFIRQNFRNLNLFHSVNHPANVLGLEIANQILAYLGLYHLSSSAEEEILYGYSFPIYPSVAQKLSIEFATPAMKYRFSYDKYLTFHEYLSEFIDRLAEVIDPAAEASEQLNNLGVDV